MAYDAFIKIDGITGESQDSNHENWIEVLSFSWGESSPGRSPSAFGGGGGAGRVAFQDFHVSALFSKASPMLFQACANGQHIQDALLSLAMPSSTPAAVGTPGGDFLKFQLTNVLVSSYQTGGTLLDDGTYSPIGDNGDGFTSALPLDQFTLAFAKLEIVYTSQVDGSVTDLAAGLPAVQ